MWGAAASMPQPAAWRALASFHYDQALTPAAARSRACPSCGVIGWDALAATHCVPRALVFDMPKPGRRRADRQLGRGYQPWTENNLPRWAVTASTVQAQVEGKDSPLEASLDHPDEFVLGAVGRATDAIYNRVGIAIGRGGEHEACDSSDGPWCDDSVRYGQVNSKGGVASANTSVSSCVRIDLRVVQRRWSVPKASQRTACRSVTDRFLSGIGSLLLWHWCVSYPTCPSLHARACLLDRS